MEEASGESEIIILIIIIIIIISKHPVGCDYGEKSESKEVK